MKEKEIEVDGNKKNIVIKLPEEYAEDNNLKVLLDCTIDLEKVVSEIRNDE